MSKTIYGTRVWQHTQDAQCNCCGRVIKLCTSVDTVYINIAGPEEITVCPECWQERKISIRKLMAEYHHPVNGRAKWILSEKLHQ